MDHSMNAARRFSVELALWDSEGAALAALRREVFVHEQNVPPEIEADGLDDNPAQSVHAVARDVEGAIVGTGRLLLNAPTPRIGRMAVKRGHRRCGIGGAILEALCAEAQRRGYQSVLLYAQTHASAFYYHHGFLSHGPEFFEAGIPHQEMRRTLTTGK